MMKKPLIGITLDHTQTGGYSEYPWYALRENYFESIENAGGIPIGLPYGHENLERYIDLIDGLLMPGGFFDIDPRTYGATTCHEKVFINERRSHFDARILKRAFEENLPFLGICAGAQMLNVLLGGTLIQHIPDEGDTFLDHEQKTPRQLTSHEIYIEEGTLLSSILKKKTIEVNSTHHQAVKELGQGVILSARAPDGIIEAIEVPTHPFCLGVQWHPEYGSTSFDHALFEAFVEKAR